MIDFYDVMMIGRQQSVLKEKRDNGGRFDAAFHLVAIVDYMRRKSSRDECAPELCCRRLFVDNGNLPMESVVIEGK